MAFLLFSSYSLGGDTDLDGELDMDVSDIVSFKGLVHFVMGASGWLKHSVSRDLVMDNTFVLLILLFRFIRINLRQSS